MAAGIAPLPFCVHALGSVGDLVFFFPPKHPILAFLRPLFCRRRITVCSPNKSHVPSTADVRRAPPNGLTPEFGFHWTGSTGEMAFAGLKKQINKANQYVSEKIGGAEGTKFTEEYMEMERKIDLTNELVEELIVKTKEYLQPNPASRAKLMVSTKLRGTGKTHAYPQPEGVLGETMVKYGGDLGEESPFGQSLIEAGESLKQLADIKYALEDNVKQNFLEPLTQLQTKDLKDVLHHRKKLQGRRLDYDCKKRKQIRASALHPGAHATEDDIKLAEDKFEESFNLASMGMFNLLENDVEQISQLAALAEAFCEYHQQCAEVLQSLTERLLEQKAEAASRERQPYEPKKLCELNLPVMHDDISPMVESGGAFYNGGPAHCALFTTGAPARGGPNGRGPCCRALYDFDPENEGELGFREGDLVTLVRRVDDNWFEGSHDGRTGLFPVNYVEVVVPLP
ncbi:endophilin-A isoform X4 [Ixodes scapularis]|uniref:endophilin-A isoform X4 n=1 Tax=Ixodes scapularis TaxID=6945 RepID=UPI001AD7B331|nr:endophilin-A isoform X4 [Ixodes scapularis]